MICDICIIYICRHSWDYRRSKTNPNI